LINNCGRSLGGVSCVTVSVHILYIPHTHDETRTQKRGQSFDVYFFGHDKPTAALFARGLSHHRDGVLGTGPKTGRERASAWRSGTTT
jgi:hypothetical protein